MLPLLLSLSTAVPPRLRAAATEFAAVHAWRDLAQAPFVFPEERDAAVMKRPPSALCFSGGGARAYSATMGFVRGLTDADLMKQFRYISGASGGAWGTTAYTYAQVGAPGVAASDEELLGDIVAPNAITLAGLAQISKTCLRGSVTLGATSIFFEQMLKLELDVRRSMIATLHDVFLARAGIPPPFSSSGGDGAPFAYSAAAAADATARNPAALGALKPSDWLLPPTTVDRPMLAIGASLVLQARLHFTLTYVNTH